MEECVICLYFILNITQMCLIIESWCLNNFQTLLSALLKNLEEKVDFGPDF